MSKEGRTRWGCGLCGSRSSLFSERVQFREPLLLFLLAGGFVVQIGLVFLLVFGIHYRCCARTRLDVVDLIGSLGRLFRRRHRGVHRAYCLHNSIGVGRGRTQDLNAYARTAVWLLKLQRSRRGLVAARRLIHAGRGARHIGRLADADCCIDDRSVLFDGGGQAEGQDQEDPDGGGMGRVWTQLL